jgi:carbon-monoxide dehydrogenase small subunit
MAFHKITVAVNGSTEMVDVPSNMTLLQLLRERLVLTGTKNGCAAGECGACTVLITWPGAKCGEPVNACMVLAVEADGAEIVTVEGLASTAPGTPGEAGRGLDAIQQAFVDLTGVQCGFCTPGMLISARALLNRTPHPTEEQIKDALLGNLCRCTGYTRIVRAVKEAVQ